jgi:peptidoglycan/LPS O-acetylase OafA/YrhL
MTYRRDIDGLRAVAILFVMAFHAAPIKYHGGFVGVDIFFVISGFLISGVIFTNLQRDSFSFQDFYFRRIRRIFPALIAVFAVLLVFGWVWMWPPEFKSLGTHILGGVGFVSNILLWYQVDYFSPAAGTLPLLHLWSLGIEEQFYLVWPVTCFLLWKRPRALVLTLVLIAASSFLFNVATAAAYPSMAFYLPMARFWELMLGSALALYETTRAPRLGANGANMASIAGLLLIAVSLALIDADSTYPGWWGLLPTIGALLLIAAGPAAWINCALLSSRPMVFVGLVSYPLYLWHWPLLSIARTINEGGIARRGTLGIYILSFVLACATYFLIERPLRFGNAHRFAFTSGLTTAMVCIGILGLVVDSESGFASRFAELSYLANYRYDFDTAYRVGTCHLHAWQHDADFKQYCYSKGGGKTLVLWGDSKAADLYPGLAASVDGRFAIEELTASACPPLIFDYEPSAAVPNCREMNLFIVNHIRATRPEVVVLSMQAGLMPSQTYTSLARTVALLREYGIEKIVVVGISPIWPSPLPEYMARAYKAQPALGFPRRLPLENRNLDIADNDLRVAIETAGGIYISPLKELCSGGMCVTLVDGEPINYTQHFTTVGSTLVAKSIIAALSP